LEDNPGLSEISGQLDVVPNRGLNPAVEIFAVVLLTVGRSVTNNLAVRYWLGVPPIRPFWYFQFAECLRGFFLSGLVLFVVYLKKEPWTELGLSRPHWVKDLLIAVSVIFTTMLLWVPISVLIGRLGPYVYQKPPIPFVNPVTTAR
jgi:hypothetical protein